MPTVAGVAKRDLLKEVLAIFGTLFSTYLEVFIAADLSICTVV